MDPIAIVIITSLVGVVSSLVARGREHRRRPDDATSHALRQVHPVRDLEPSTTGELAADVDAVRRAVDASGGGADAGLAAAVERASREVRVAGAAHPSSARAADQDADTKAAVNEAILTMKLEALEQRVVELDARQLSRWDVATTVFAIAAAIGTVVALLTYTANADGDGADASRDQVLTPRGQNQPAVHLVLDDR